jgi:hypothetical protein
LHALDTHVFEVVPVLVAHVVPHAPQLVAVVRLVSQPSVCLLPLQSPKFALQVPLQTPPEHVGVVMLALEHVVPHALQLVALVLMFVSHPSAAPPLQLPKPELHATEHVPVPEAQLAVPFAPVHAPEQQNPPAQVPPVHWLLPVHATPAAFLATQFVPLQ